MFTRIYNQWARWQACKMTAQVMQGQGLGNEADGAAPKIWSLAVFFETYLYEGAEGTHEDFGPKEPVVLSEVKNSNA